MVWGFLCSYVGCLNVCVWSDVCFGGNLVGGKVLVMDRLLLVFLLLLGVEWLLCCDVDFGWGGWWLWWVVFCFWLLRFLYFLIFCFVMEVLGLEMFWVREFEFLWVLRECFVWWLCCGGCGLFCFGCFCWCCCGVCFGFFDEVGVLLLVMIGFIVFVIFGSGVVL